MKVFIPGGCGYLGARLVPKLLADGHDVTVLDTQWFGTGDLPADNGRLRVLTGDVRDEQKLRRSAKNADAILWLASVSNNAMYARDYALTHSVNAECFAQADVICRNAPIFIYASSVAVLDPTSDYAKDKLACEALLKGSSAIIVRSASVCGYSPRMRLDLTVNMMAHDAYKKGVITVAGGEQERTHIHIDDLCDFYRAALKHGEQRKTYTVWSISEKVKHTAQTVQDIFKKHGRDVMIEYQPRSDNRSYSVDGDSCRSIGWAAKRSVGDAVRDLIVKFDSGYWKDSAENEIYQNLATGLR